MLKEAKDVYFKEFSAEQRISDNKQIGSLQRQISYFGLFEEIYKKSLQLLTQRLTELTTANDELRFQ